MNINEKDDLVSLNKIEEKIISLIDSFYRAYYSDIN